MDNPAVAPKNTSSSQHVDDEPYMKLAEASFRTVLEADLHEDDKATRILSAVAFLTAVATGLFVSVYSSSPSEATLEQALQPVQALNKLSSSQIAQIASQASQNLQKSPFITVAVVLFSLYILCVLIGAIFYLVALGPNLNIPNLNKSSKGGIDSKEEQPASDKKHPSVKETLESLLFFEKISKVDAVNWSEHWENKSTSDLHIEMIENYYRESFFIAQKTSDKVYLMRRGNAFFQIAVFLLFSLAAILLLSNPNLPSLVIIPIVVVVIIVLLFVWRFALRRLNHKPH